jgi:hypothetical protein
LFNTETAPPKTLNPCCDKTAVWSIVISINRMINSSISSMDCLLLLMLLLWLLPPPPPCDDDHPSGLTPAAAATLLLGCHILQVYVHDSIFRPARSGSASFDFLKYTQTTLPGEAQGLLSAPLTSSQYGSRHLAALGCHSLTAAWLAA